MLWKPVVFLVIGALVCLAVAWSSMRGFDQRKLWLAGQNGDGSIDLVFWQSRHGWPLDCATRTWGLSTEGGDLRPVWSGLSIDTAFYAAMTACLVFAVVHGRSFVRRRRGLCAGCAYDLRGASGHGCPECGRGRQLTQSATSQQLRANS
jgi:hypothetical protein